ncbi:hypothetical protein [Polaribacter aquimarinus]|uniref:Lipoprotein n=1 Tax=Polaribacter aquimarinus TaxID=2100726 RepID=A0A2U2JA97_9FLAO|nr:hypothetical protein [Polaribacter aquimarinus]PWG05266.1 hypothetical protein DIS07_08495 [Polaribacter aquimarinus]
MKTNKIIKLSLAVFAFTAIIITSCKSFDKLDDFQLEINTDIFAQQVLVEIFDPSDQNNLQGENVLKVEVMGADANKLVTDAGEDISNLKVVDGAIALAVNPNKNTSKDPVQFMLKISGDNYLTTTIPVILTESDSIATFSANVVNKFSTPKGIDYTSSSKNLSNNMLDSDFTIETTAVKAKTKSVVKVDSGTMFMDENGNNISGSKIESEVVHFSNTDDEALSSFPGGFTPEAITDENGNVDTEAYFQTAGFVSIDMKIGNKEVKQFSKPITITMKVAPDFVNPDTGAPVKAGDEVPIWSYSKDDGKWDYHFKGKVSDDGNGGLEVKYTTTHLSWYNLDFKGRRCRSWTRTNGRWTRTPLAKISLTMNGVSRSNSKRLFTDFVFAGTNQSVSNFSGKTKTFYDGQTFDLRNAPSGRQLQMVVYSGRSRYRKGSVLFKSQAFDGCSGTVNVNMSPIVSQLPNLVNVTVSYKGVCNGTLIAPTIPLYMKTNGYWRYIGYVYRGRVTIRQIELNKPYEFRTYYRGKYYTQTMTFDKTEYINHNYQVPQSLCDKFF